MIRRHDKKKAPLTRKEWGVIVTAAVLLVGEAFWTGYRGWTFERQLEAKAHSASIYDPTSTWGIQRFPDSDVRGGIGAGKVDRNQR